MNDISFIATPNSYEMLIVKTIASLRIPSQPNRKKVFALRSKLLVHSSYLGHTPSAIEINLFYAQGGIYLQGFSLAENLYGI